MKNLENLSDANLILKYQSGDKKAISILVKRWHLKFCKFAFWYVKDADIAKDIAQESWAIIIDKIYELKEPEKFKSWAISIVNRKSIDWIRAKNREDNKLHTLFNEKSKPDLYEMNEVDQNRKQLLLTSIQNLSDEQRMVIKLFYTQNYRLKEISEILKISVGTAKSRLFHAREKLKTILKQKDHEG